MNYRKVIPIIPRATMKVLHMFMAASVTVTLLAAGMLVGGPGSAHADPLSKPQCCSGVVSPTRIPSD